MITEDSKIGFEIKKKPQHVKKNQRASIIQSKNRNINKWLFRL